MNRLSTFPLPAAAPAAGGAPDGLCDEVPGGFPDPDLPPPQALNNNEHPSARIAVRRTLYIKRIPFAVESASYIAAGVRGTGPTRRRRVSTSHVQQQMLALPRADDLCEGFVL